MDEGKERRGSVERIHFFRAGDEELGFLCHNPDVGFDQNSERMAKEKAMGFGQTGRNSRILTNIDIYSSISHQRFRPLIT